MRNRKKKYLEARIDEIDMLIRDNNEKISKLKTDLPNYATKKKNWYNKNYMVYQYKKKTYTKETYNGIDEAKEAILQLEKTN